MPLSFKKSMQRRLALHPATFAFRRFKARFRQLQADAHRPILALWVSDGGAYTSEQQMAPLARHAAILESQIGLVAQHRSLSDALKLDARAIARFDLVGLKFEFKMEMIEARRIVSHFRQLIAGSQVRLIYLDGDDDLNVQWPPILSELDLYVKKHVFADAGMYTVRYLGKSNLTDHSAQTYQVSFEQDIIPTSGGVQPSQIDRIFTGWNIALDDKIVELAERSESLPELPRDIDISCRAYVPPTVWTHGMRSAAIDRILAMSQRFKVLAPRDRVPQEEYYREMLRSKICVSPFGYGEICWRDFEAVLCGCLLVKPDMSHLRTEPNLFVPNETYVPVRWDYADLEERCSYYLEHEHERQAIVRRARSKLSASLQPAWLVSRVDELLSRLKLRPSD